MSVYFGKYFNLVAFDETQRVIYTACHFYLYS